MNTVRWGLLSTANINRRLIPAIRASHRGDLVAVASRTSDQARAYAEQWDIPKSFGSYNAMLESGEIDAVYISLPNHMHAAWSIRAMEAGLHVLCEKPFAISLEEVDQMIQTSISTTRVLAEAFMYRHHPQTKIVGEMVKAGKLGDISMIQGAFSFPMATRENVRLVPEWGGGALWDIGVYPMSYAQYIYGAPPQEVMALQWIGDTGVDENFVGQMQYPNGGFAQFTCSFQRPMHTYIEICGSQGRLYISRPFISLEDNEAIVNFEPKNGNPELIEVPEKLLYLGEVEDMHAAILDGKPNYLTLSETRDHIRTVLALYESARTGKRIEL